MNMPYTYRILAKTIGVDRVRPGESYTFPVERRIIYAWPALSDWFAQMIDERFSGEIPQSENLYMTFDHYLPIKNAAQEEFISQSKAWAYEKGIHVSEGEGIGHVLAIEQGWVKPGMVVPHFDTHASSFGAIGALGLGLLKEMLFPLATNHLWLEIPPLLRIDLKGHFQNGVMGRDLLHKIIRDVGLEKCGGSIIEFGGAGAVSMPLEDRISLCNLINTTSAISAVFDLDDEECDSGEYQDRIAIQLDDVEPYVAAPPSTANVMPLSQAAGTHVDMGIIGTCAGGGLRDIKMAATILRGRKIADGRSLYVVPATKHIYEEAIRLGYIEVLSEAGCFISSPTCDFCYGAATYLGAHKTAISTQTLNVNGRLGSLDANIYLASAAAVAAALAEGEISDPRKFWKRGPTA